MLCSISGKIRKDSTLTKVDVKPALEERPRITSATPVYDPSFVSRENPIRIRFSQLLDRDSFIFSVQDLINLGVLKSDSTDDNIMIESEFINNDEVFLFELLSDSEDNIYGYKDLKTSFVYFKNIEITTDSGVVSIADSFKQPNLTVEEGNENCSVLEIPTDPEHLIEIGNAGFRTVGVKISKSVMNENGIELLDDYSWGYQVSAATLERASIVFECESGQGALDDTLVSSTARKYNKGQQISLNFTEDADYQFIRWDFDPRYVTIPLYKRAAATARVIDQTPEGISTAIKAICVPRLKVEFARPEQDEDDETRVFPKDSTVNIRFSQNIPMGEDDIAQIDNINLAIGGVSVKSCFENPLENNAINGSQITYYADPLSRIQLSEGQTKTVTISIPADFYYIVNYKDEDFHVTLGREFVKNYKINHKTVDSAQVTFGTTDNDAGKIILVGKTDGELFQEFQMGDIQEVKCELKDGYQFENWTVTSNGTPVDEAKIKLSSYDTPNTTVQVFQKVTGVNVTAHVSQVLKVTDCTVSGANEGTRDDPKNKDASIVINFNQPLDLAARKFKLSDVAITADGVGVTSSYNVAVSADNTKLTITNEKRLAVNEGETKNIQIKIPKSFYYKKDNKEIHLPQDVIIDFYIDHKTTQQAEVNYQIIQRDVIGNVKTDTILTADDEDGTSVAGKLKTGKPSDSVLTHTKLGRYYLDQKVALEFETTDEYQFYSWEVEGNNEITKPAKNAISSFTVNNGTAVGSGGITVKAIVYKRPQVNEDETSPLNSSMATPLSSGEDSYPKDEPIVIKFRHAIDPKAASKITIDFTGEDYNQKDYFKAIESDDGSTYTFQSIKYLKLRANHETEDVTVTIPYDVYYMAEDGRTPICASDVRDVQFTYKVNNTTSQMTALRLEFEDGKGKIKYPGTTINANSTEKFSKGESVEFTYEPSSTGYKFNGWKIEPASSEYTVTPSGFTTSENIVVEKDGKVYFTLNINSSDPSRATAVFNDYITAVGTYALRLTTREYQMPFVGSFTTKANQTTVECDTPVRIEFTKQMNQGLLSLYNSTTRTGSIQIVSAANTDVHYEENFEISYVGTDNKVIKLVPNVRIYDLLGSQKSLDLKVILTKDEIKDSDGHTLEGNNEFTYRINQETNKKTKVKFSYDNTHSTLKVNNENSALEKDWSIGKEFKISIKPNSGYALKVWDIPVDSSEYIEVEDKYAEETYVYVKSGKDTNPYPEITLTPVVYEVPKIDLYAPVYSKEGAACNSTIRITFNKPINTSKCKLYNENTDEGEIQIVSLINPNQHFEEYFRKDATEASPWSSDDKILTLEPKDSITEILGNNNTLDLKVIIDSDTVRDAEGYELAGTTEWTYRINTKTVSKTKVKFTLSETPSSLPTITVGGNSITINDEGILYDLGKRLAVKFTSSDYAVGSWKINGNTTSEYVSVTEDATGTYLNINKAKGNDSDAEVIQAVIYKIPTASSSATTTTASAFDSNVVINFNTEIDENTLTGNISIYDPYIPSNTYEDYFSWELDSTKKILTLTPYVTTDKNIYDLLANSETKDLKIELASDSIKDIEGHALTGTASWNYRISKTSSQKATVTFNFAGTHTTVAVKNNTGYKTLTDGESISCDKYQKVEIKCTPDTGYALSNWSVTSTGSSAHVENAYNNETVLTIDNVSSGITVKPISYLIPVVESAPNALSAQPYNKAIEIILNQEVKAVAPYSFELYDGSNNGLIRIEDTEYNRCENYFTSSKTTENGKTKITLSPTAEIFNLLGSAQTKAFNISLIPSSKIVEAKNHALTGETTWRYKINRTTVNKTTLNLTEGSTSEDVKKYTLTVNNENYPKTAAPEGYYDYSINNELEIECTPSVPGYAFKEWIIENYGGSDAGTALTDSEIIIQNKYSSRTKVTIKKALAAEVTITPKLYLIPKATTESIFNKDGEQFNKEITINFNTDLDTSTLTLYDSSTKTGNIQIVSAQNEEDHYEDKFSSTVSFSYNSTSKVGTLTLTPNDSLYNIIGSDGFKELIIIFNKDGIKDSAGNYLGGKNNFNYKINTKSTKKTTVYFALTTSTTTGFDVTVDDESALAVSNATGYELYSTYKIKCTPKDPANYAFDSWEITTSGGTSYITIADVNAAETTLYVKEYTSSTITVTPKVYLIPKITSKPVYNQAGREFDKSISIAFNQTMYAPEGKVIDLYSTTNTEGIISITDVNNEESHYETYFTLSPASSNSASTITLQPRDTLLSQIGNNKTKELKITLKKDALTMSGYANNHSFDETTSWNYSINKTSCTDQNVKFTVSNCTVYVKNANGEYSAVTNGVTTEYDKGSVLSVKCVPASGYAFNTWKMSSTTSASAKEATSVETDLTLKTYSSTTLEVTPVCYKVPEVTTAPVYNEKGIEFDKSISITFNQTMKPKTNDYSFRMKSSTYPNGVVSVILKGTTTDVSSYFTLTNAGAASATTLTITPTDSFYTSYLSNTETKDVTIKLNANNIVTYTADGNSNSHALTGTSSWDYRINKNSVNKTKVKINIGDDDRANCFVSLAGAEVDAGREYSYDRLQTLDLEFVSLNEEWRFKQWNVTVSGSAKYSVGTNTSVNSGSTTISTSPTKITIKTDSATTAGLITITPVLRSVPIVNDVLTKPDNLPFGVNMDTSIEIPFTKRILANTLALTVLNTNGTIKTQNSIDIEVYDERSNTWKHVENYFKKAPLGTTGTNGSLLILHPDGSKIENLFGGTSFLKFRLTLDCKKIKDTSTSGESLYDALEENSNKKYVKEFTYNSGRTTAIPDMILCDCFTLNFDNQELYTNDIVKEDTTVIPSESITSSYVKFDITADDSGSGIKGLLIEETLVRALDGTYKNEVVYSSESPEGTVNEESIGRYKIYDTYNLHSSEDGLVKLKVKVINYAEINSSKEYIVYTFRDTTLNVYDYYLTNTTDTKSDMPTSTSSKAIAVSTFNAESLKFYINPSETLMQNQNGDVIFDLSNSQISVSFRVSTSVTRATQYKGDTLWNSATELTSTKGTQSGNYIPYTLNLSSYAEQNKTSSLYIIVKIYDYAGNSIFKIYQIPKDQVIKKYGTLPNALSFAFDNTDDFMEGCTYNNYLLRSPSTSGTTNAYRPSASYRTESYDYAKYTYYNANNTASISKPNYYFGEKSYSYYSPAGNVIKIYGKIGIFNDGNTIAHDFANISLTKDTSIAVPTISNATVTPRVNYTATGYTAYGNMLNSGLNTISVTLSSTNYDTNNYKYYILTDPNTGTVPTTYTNSTWHTEADFSTSRTATITVNSPNPATVSTPLSERFGDYLRVIAIEEGTGNYNISSAKSVILTDTTPPYCYTIQTHTETDYSGSLLTVQMVDEGAIYQSETESWIETQFYTSEKTLKGNNLLSDDRYWILPWQAPYEQLLPENAVTELELKQYGEGLIPKDPQLFDKMIYLTDLTPGKYLLCYKCTDPSDNVFIGGAGYFKYGDVGNTVNDTLKITPSRSLIQYTKSITGKPNDSNVGTNNITLDVTHYCMGPQFNVKEDLNTTDYYWKLIVELFDTSTGYWPYEYYDNGGKQKIQHFDITFEANQGSGGGYNFWPKIPTNPPEFVYCKPKYDTDNDPKLLVKKGNTIINKGEYPSYQTLINRSYQSCDSTEKYKADCYKFYVMKYSKGTNIGVDNPEKNAAGAPIYEVLKSKPMYYFPIDKNELTRPELNSYSWKNSETIDIISSDPLLVETYISSTNYEDVEDWERYAKPVSSLYLKQSGSYVINRNAVEPGQYYRILIHFADFTCQATEVEQKPW